MWLISLACILPFLMLLVLIRDINTRRREGILFKTYRKEHYKVRQDPLVRAMDAWNSLPICIRNAETKEKLKKMLVGSIQNPYQKTE